LNSPSFHPIPYHTIPATEGLTMKIQPPTTDQEPLL
jgi:hypothetical protein